MVSGMAHISGGMMAVYLNYGADPVAVLTTCHHGAARCSSIFPNFHARAGHPVTAGTTRVGARHPLMRMASICRSRRDRGRFAPRLNWRRC